MNDLVYLIKSAPVSSLIFTATLVTSIFAFNDENFKTKLSLRPYRFVRLKEFWTVISSGFVHGNMIHLLVNMLTFYFFAFILEQRMVLLEVLHIKDPSNWHYFLGHFKFFILYFGTLILSDISTIIKYKELPSYSSLGASGALSGVIAAAIVIMPGLTVYGYIPGWMFLIIFVAISYFNSRNSQDNINHDAHLWGAVSGFVITIAMFPNSFLLLIRSIKGIF